VADCLFARLGFRIGADLGLVRGGGARRPQRRRGNIWGRLAGDEAGPVVASDSRIDSQTPGGRYDGVLGVIAALVALRSFDQAWQTNVKGTFFCGQAVIPQMLAQGSGRIMNFLERGDLALDNVASRRDARRAAWGARRPHQATPSSD